MAASEIYIVGAARTPIGAFQGGLSHLPAPRLGAVAIQGALRRARVEPSQIDAVFMGNVLSAGVGQAPARQAAIYAGLPNAAPATTLSKVCGSGLEAIIHGVRALLVGDAQCVVAGGMESMSGTPYLLTKGRGGYRMGHGTLVDSLLHDGLWDPYGQFHMGSAGEASARALGVSREAQDAYARTSYERAREAQDGGAFCAEIEPVTISGTRGTQTVEHDEEPRRVDLARMASLPGVFAEGGSITAANASKINDGASALVLASAPVVRRDGLEPIARVVAYAAHAQAPAEFPTAPIEATQKALASAGLAPGEIDLYEINEAFAAVTLICARGLDVPLARVNVRGGAVALGHPIGASGARIVTTLVHTLRDRGLRRGVATICIGGGEALALVVERS